MMGQGGNMPVSDSVKKAVRKYDDANTTKVVLKLNNKTDADILDWLGQSDNKQGYIKKLIRKDIAENDGSEDW